MANPTSPCSNSPLGSSYEEYATTLLERPDRGQTQLKAVFDSQGYGCQNGCNSETETLSVSLAEGATVGTEQLTRGTHAALYESPKEGPPARRGKPRNIGS